MANHDAIYTPQRRRIGPAVNAQWLHTSDDVQTRPLESDEGYSSDTGRLFSYREYVPAKNIKPGDVGTSFPQDFYWRVQEWVLDLTNYGTSIIAPTIHISDTGDSVFPGTYDIVFDTSAAVSPAIGPTIVGSRAIYNLAEGLLPCNTPFAPNPMDMDFTCNSLGFKPVTGLPDIGAAFVVKIPGSQVLRYPADFGSSFIPYHLEFQFIGGVDGVNFGGGWSTEWPRDNSGAPYADKPQFSQDGTFITVNFTTNGPAFGSSTRDQHVTSFNLYQYTWTDLASGFGTLPIFNLDASSWTGGGPFLFIPGTAGYFAYADPTDLSRTIYDSATGMRTSGAPMTLTMPPLLAH